MQTSQCIPQRISKLFLGLIFMAAAAALVIIGITLVPVFGFILAVPVAALGIYFFRAHLNKECQIDFSS